MGITKAVEDNLTIFTVTGAVSAEDIVSKAAEHMAAPETENALWDFTQASSLKLTTEAVEQIAKKLSSHAAQIKGGKVALVGSKTVNIGLGKMFQVYATLAGLPRTYRTFRKIQRAIDWLKSP